MMKNLLKSMFSPYSTSQIFKLLAVAGIVGINLYIKHWVVATASVLMLGTFIASEAFILMLARSIFKNPTDENIVKLFIILLFKDQEQADKILDAYQEKK